MMQLPVEGKRPKSFQRATVGSLREKGHRTRSLVFKGYCKKKKKKSTYIVPVHTEADFTHSAH
jgi:hypothetical protein